jgi:HD-GYP domain-containing protein (c-di-GMP phosphodiesterase class II)
VRDAVLLKPGALTVDERQLVERHPAVGLDILAPVNLTPEVKEFVGGHHEKLDGSGYPSRRRDSQLTLIARIASAADIYDALTTDRPYRAAMTPEEALDILRQEAVEGRLDRHVVTTLEELVPRWERRRRSDPALKGFRLSEGPIEKAA